MSTPTRIAVLASGGGSNLQAIIDHFATENPSAEVVWVGSNRGNCGALARAKAASIPTAVIEPADGAALLGKLKDHNVDLLVLAGYLRLVPREVTAAFRGRIINIHPALLPAFGGAGMYGTKVHEAVIASGATVTGVTVHFVDEEYDRGAVIGQWPVPVLPGDTAATVAARVLHIEHILYPLCIELLARGQISLAPGGSGVVRKGPSAATAALTSLSPAEAAFSLAALSPSAAASQLRQAITQLLLP